MIYFLLLVFVLSFLLTLNSVPRLMVLAWRKGFLDMPGPRKIHTTPIPYGGGIGVAIGVLAPIVGGIAAAWAHTRGWLTLPDAIHVHVPGAISQFPRLSLLVCASLVILLLGLVDDKWKLRPGVKLLVQTLVALGMALGYERLSLFAEGTRAGDAVGVAVTVLWIVGVTNAFNLLDHMDGLSAGVAAVAGACFLAVAVFTGQWFIAALLAALLGGCLGFLLFNFPPAKVFLGDAGSQFIGFVLASLTVSFTFYTPDDPLYAYAVPILILSVPLFDTSSVVLLRIRGGRSPFEADTNHFAHRLTALGLTRRAAVITIYGLTLVTGIAAVLLYWVGHAGAVLILAQTAIIFAIITILEAKGRAK